MADPVTLGVMAVGGKVLGGVANARSASAQQAQQNQQALDRHNLANYKAKSQTIQANAAAAAKAAAIARMNRAIERNSLRQLYINSQSLQIEQTNKRSDLIKKSNENAEIIKTRAMQSNLQSESAMLERIQRLQTKEMAKGMSDTDRLFEIQRKNLVEARKKALASRGDESFVPQQFVEGEVGTFYDSSSANMTGALLGAIGSAAGTIHGFID